MEREYLVITYIGREGKAFAHFHGRKEFADYAARGSFLTGDDKIAIPLWFASEESAQDYLRKVATNEEREYLLIQEFTYENEIRQGEAKVVFSIKSDTWPTLDQGRTERSPGIWANVRSFFLFDKESAFIYVRQFNEDAAAKYAAANKREAVNV